MSTGAARSVLLTYDDLQSLPEDGCRYEILEGELTVTPAPTTAHQRISRNLEFVLHAHVMAGDLGEVFDAPIDVVFDRGTVMQPDLVFVSQARLGIVRERCIDGAPDLVIEILSPGTERRDRGAKQQIYERYGVTHYWRVDPASQSLTELVLREGAYVLRGAHGSGEDFRSLLFPELAIDLALAFRIPSAPGG